MRIIADCGSTKIDWAAISADGRVERIHTPGYNAASAADGSLASSAREALEGVRLSATRVEFYGAGCAGEAVCSRVSGELATLFPTAEIEVNSDMLLAARALCHSNVGIACILGTGANSCLFDGERIVRNHPALGFILGDEGSGAVMGRILLSDYFKGQLPDDVAALVRADYPTLTQAEVIERVYRTPRPNAYLASFMPFYSRHISHPHVSEMVVNEFRRFLRRNVRQYFTEGLPADTPIHFTGSVAHHFAPSLLKALATENFTPGRIIANPLDAMLL